MPEIRIALTAGEAARANRHWTDADHRDAAALWRNLYECDRLALAHCHWRRVLGGAALLAMVVVLMIAGLL